MKIGKIQQNPNCGLGDDVPTARGSSAYAPMVLVASDQEFGRAVGLPYIRDARE